MRDAAARPPATRANDERVARYLAERNPIVDRLLPEGRGGTRFYEHLGGFAGIATAGPAAIGLSLAVDFGGWPESVELHERAHLLYAFAPAEATAVLGRLTGTAGFVLRYLDQMHPADVEGHENVRAVADRLSAPAREVWSALWRTIDARREANGHFQPWGARTIHEYIAVERHSAAATSWLGRVASVAYLPSLALATIADVIS